MNNSNDFMMYLHQDKVQRLRQEAWMNQEFSTGKLTNHTLQSPFVRVRNAISTWVAGARNHDINPS